ncbi:hypothetical protein POM88_002573 [Heracleum sosnowskyi]|uniref:Uncharacterized protein n=1 Tax=Heracleum sosnowskyi TaxID=360622 RepID=A0AAD8JFS2_9APIA|nr:hypothetical protein POM88_002573 [Heracleum sosnowskyi]
MESGAKKKQRILAPKLRNFSSVGILSITLEVPELENVLIKLNGWFWNMDWIYRKKLYRLFTDMLSGLGNAKNLTFDLNSIEALSAADFLASLPSPFCNLKIVKLPLKYKESSISTDLRNYLLGSSPRATIVTTLPQIMPMPVSVTSQNVGLGEPLANPTVELVDSQGAGNDCASSSREKKDFGLWQGYEVNSEFVVLLDLIMKRYPETFEHFITKNKKLCTMRLNMLCTSVNAFTTTTMTEIDAEMITEYRTLFGDLQRSFNIKWLVSRLNYIEQFHFSQNELHAIDSSIDDAKSKLLVLQNLRTEKMTKMQEAFGTMGTNLVSTAGYIGDDLLPSP